MEFIQFLLVGSVFILSVFILWFWNYKKKVAGVPVLNILSQFIHWKITGKISKDTPLNNVVFEKLIEMGKRHSKEGLFMMFTYHPLLFIYSSEAIKFFANEKTLDKASEYKIAEEAMGAGLGTSNGERWKTHRRLINPAFNMGALKEKIPLFNKYAMTLVEDMEKLSGKESVRILDILKIHYFYAMSESVLGLNQDDKNKEMLLKRSGYVDNLSRMIVKRMFSPWLRWKFVMNFFPSGRKYLQELQSVEDYINYIISDMKKQIVSNENGHDEYFRNNLRKSFAYLLLNHHLNNPETFTMKDLRDEVKTIMVTGYDTVAYTTMWCLYMLGMHPEIQEKVFCEIQSATSDYISYEESCNLNYLEAVIMETLRLYPTAPTFARNLAEDVQYGKYKIFKGTSIFFFPYLSHKDPKIYPDPEKFDPDRFLNTISKKACNFMPFGEGSRSCIGKNYGMIELKIFLAHILRNFKITSLDRREDIKLCLTIIMSTVKPLNFKLTSRNNTDSSSQ